MHFPLLELYQCFDLLNFSIWYPSDTLIWVSTSLFGYRFPSFVKWVYSPVTTSREGENKCIDESFDDVIMPKAIDSGEFCLSKNAHENRAFSELSAIIEGDEIALPRKDEFSMDEIITDS